MIAPAEGTEIKLSIYRQADKWGEDLQVLLKEESRLPVPKPINLLITLVMIS